MALLLTRPMGDCLSLLAGVHAIMMANPTPQHPRTAFSTRKRHLRTLQDALQHRRCWAKRDECDHHWPRITNEEGRSVPLKQHR